MERVPRRARLFLVTTAIRLAFGQLAAVITASAVTIVAVVLLASGWPGGGCDHGEPPHG